MPEPAPMKLHRLSAHGISARISNVRAHLLPFESVDTIIMKPHKPAASEPESRSDSLERQPQTLGRYGSACTLKDRHAQ